MAIMQALLSLHSSCYPTPLTTSTFRYQLPTQTSKAFSPHFNTTKFTSITENHHVFRATKLGLLRKPINSIQSCKAQMEDSRNNIISEMDTRTKKVLQVALWAMEGVYIWWLFLLPFAPGDPVWAIKPDTIKVLLDLSLNFFFILPLANAAGFHLMEAPVLHPTCEALFNFVIGWTLMFAPLLFTDRKRDRFGGSLETLWGVQMFLTNSTPEPGPLSVRISYDIAFHMLCCSHLKTKWDGFYRFPFICNLVLWLTLHNILCCYQNVLLYSVTAVLIPYMAIRLNERTTSASSESQYINSGFQSVMTSGARIIGVVGGLVGGISVVWALFGRPDAGFGNLAARWDFFVNYLQSDRPAYAFIWDICLYTIFQPWLIGDNLENVDERKIETVRFLRFVPYLGLVAYLLGLAVKED